MPIALDAMAARLTDIADCVASEAEAAVTIVRGMTDQAARVATLAAELKIAAERVEASVGQQAQALKLAHAGLTTNRPIIVALEESVASVASISAAIALIAQESAMLSLNARIEAARAGSDGTSFGVVASAMSMLSGKTKDATARIGERAVAMVDDVGAAHHLVDAHAGLIAEQDDLLAFSRSGAVAQRRAADELAVITAQTTGTVEHAASAIGRVGANAVAVKVLARQLRRMGEPDRNAA